MKNIVMLTVYKNPALQSKWLEAVKYLRTLSKTPWILDVAVGKK